MSVRGKRVSQKEIVAKCNDLNLEYVKYEFKEHDTVIYYICKKHPTIGIQTITWSHLKNARFGCRICCGKYQNIQEFILGNPQINTNVHILGEYVKYDKPLCCECNDCGHLWSTTPTSLRTGSGCPECGKRKRGFSRRTSPQEFARRVYENNPNIELVTEYSRLDDPITCKCKIDGTVFTVSTARNLLYENVQCPFCSTSKSEQEIMKILNKHGYVYEFHYRFDDCRYINILEFDFALFDEQHNILCLIEYDGEQHFKPIDFAGKGEVWALNQLHITQERDKVKTNYCYQNNIPLIRIPYWEKKDVERFLISSVNALYSAIV